jgi:hypothetical protein
MPVNNYDEIINLPHHVSETRPRMSQHDRAAQFSPFAALTGYDSEIKETERLTDEKLELDDYAISRIDSCLQILIDNAQGRPTISITFFKADERKNGGTYATFSGDFRRIDESNHTVVLTDGTTIPIEDIYAIEGNIFRLFDEII